MLNRFKKIVNIFFILLLPCTCIFAQETQDKKPGRLSDYRIVQYISFREFSPINITRLDNNGDILLACRSGKTIEQILGMGINTTDSQILLLEIYGLLSKKDKVYKTAFPILDPDQTKQIRKYSKGVSKNLIQIIKPDVVELVDILQKTGREKNAYSILFAYILDGMSWNEFESKGLVQSTVIDVDHPFWAGEVYAFYPDRSFTCGTNTRYEGSYAFKINWSHAANQYLNLFYKEMKKIDDKMVHRVMETGLIEDESVRKAFIPFNIIDNDGRLTIPVIDESEDNSIYMTGKKIAIKMAENTLELTSFDKLKEEFDFRDIKQTIVVFYHELIWDVMDALENHSIISKPIAFTDSRSVTKNDIADLMFIVKTQ